MRKFAQLLELLALTPSRNRKIEALSALFRQRRRIPIAATPSPSSPAR